MCAGRAGVGARGLRAAAELGQSRAAKEGAISARDYEAAARSRDTEKVLQQRYQLVRITRLVGLVEPRSRGQ